MFNQELSIINKVYDTAKRLNTYVVSNVNGFYSSNDGININGTSLVKSNGMVCRILMSDATDYVSPKEYTGTGWTLKNDDYIVKGTITSVESIKDVIEAYECFKITNVSIKDYGSTDMQHFEISGE